ncbi:MAG: T9SS type A sorting domain-containing protein [Chitinophagaceae bacterium]|nr:T9SS type A sorting domain-containing protein [Chitinophagaceae bacterium]
MNDLTGKIAVIERSGCTPPASYFVTKANKAQLAGAVGVIFIFNQPGNQVATMGLPAGPNPTITIPLMLVSNDYGNTLKAELLAGPVNVSLSAPTVIAEDACSFASITHQQTFTPGSCPSSYTLVNTWTATDQCGNATTKSQTITVSDTTAPTLTVPANITLQCTDPLPFEPLHINNSVNNQPGTYNVGTAIFGAPLTSTPLTANAEMVLDNAGNPYDACETITNNLTGKIAVIERSGCNPPSGYFVNKAYKAQQAGAVGVIFINNIAGDYVFTMGLPAGPNPTITIPLMLVSNVYGNTLKAAILAGSVNVSLSAPTVIANDVCSFTSITNTTTTTPGSCPSNYTIVKTWTATDQCGNSTSASQTITVADNTAPVVTCKANQTRLTNNGYCTYTAVGTEFNVSSATDNCPAAVGLSYTLSGATSGSGINTLSGTAFNTGITTVTWKATDGCGNFATCSFNITINDDQNSTGYIIYAKSYAKFGEENDINGDVGVTDANGSAEFKKNTDLNPFFVKARNISVQLPANVSNRFYTPATGGPNPPFMLYNGTGGAGSLNANVNGTYNGNYKNLTVKKGVTATITGNDFGKIIIEEGANVTFTAVIINIQQILVEKGKKNVNTTNVYFFNPASVKISEKVTVDQDCMINVNGPKVTFYLGDNKKDEENFTVTGDNTMITLNVMIPNGKLKVIGGPRYGTMTGWFITEKIESTGKKTIWNKYDCSAEPQFAKSSSENVVPAINEKPIELETPVVAEVFAVKVYPNPTPGDFNIQVITKSNEPIMVRIMDVNGKLIQASTKLTKQGLITLTNRLPGGTYFVEVTQGKNHSVTKLVKLN